MGQTGQCITYEAINQAYIDARKRISKYLNLKNQLKPCLDIFRIILKRICSNYFL